MKGCPLYIFSLSLSFFLSFFLSLSHTYLILLITHTDTHCFFCFFLAPPHTLAQDQRGPCDPARPGGGRGEPVSGLAGARETLHGRVQKLLCRALLQDGPSAESQGK